MSNKRVVCESFATRHFISSKQITGDEMEAVYQLERAKSEITASSRSHIARLSLEPTWGLLQAMLNKVYDYTASSLVLYVVGQYASGEVVARTVFEAATNVLYVLDGNRLERLQEYFSSYIAAERRQNELWLKSISKLKDGERKVHEWGLRKKARALDGSEKFLITASEQIGSVYKPGSRWPNTFEKLRVLGRETTYRTVYAAMCSQAHNDAEDLLNEFVVCSTGVSELKKKLAVETVNFSRMLIYVGLQYYLEASHAFSECFGLAKAATEISKGYAVISEILTAIAVDIGIGSSPGCDERSHP